MAEADKENCPPLSEGFSASTCTFASTSTNSASNTLSSKQSTNSAQVAFPVEEPDGDRDVLAADGKTLRKKRSVLFYPSAGLAAKSNQQPFSRSAAKRDSIMALGSIGYLQHLYTKQGIANRNRPLTKGAMTLAIGPAGEAMVLSNADNSTAGSPTSESPTTAANGQLTPNGILEEDEHLLLPPSPEAGSFARPKYLEVAKPLEADTHALRALLVADLDRLCDAWHLSDWIATNRAVAPIKQLLSEGSLSKAARQPDSSASTDLVRIIDVTTKAIRSVRSYILALPQRSKIPMTLPNEPSRRDRFKRQPSFSGVSRPGQAGMPVPARSNEILHHIATPDDSLSREPPCSPLTSAPSPGGRSLSSRADTDEDPLGVIRKAALEMLSALQEMEKKTRIEILDVNSDETGYLSAAISRDPDESSSTGSATPGTGYLYRSDLVLSDFAAEREMLLRYLETVGSVLSSLMISCQDMRRRSSTGTEHAREAQALTSTVNSSGNAAPSIHIDAANDDDVASKAGPIWTEPGVSAAQRVSSFMIDHCEAVIGSTSRLERMQEARDDIEALLALLSDGYLLCCAFNEAVRRSDKPWGYISSREMHDLEAEEAVLLHKETSRAKSAQEAAMLTFQTRFSRKADASEGALNVDDVEARVRVEENTGNRPGWTFRRTENLRVWAAALKLRYQVQTTATRANAAKPGSILTYGSLGLGKLALHGRRAASESHALSSGGPSTGLGSKTIDFDPAKVARRESGWHLMLTTLLMAWIDAVAHEQLLM